jgi:hypothetical protein
MATTATGNPAAQPRRGPAATPPAVSGDLASLSDPALISSWSLARVQVALNPGDPGAVRAYDALRDEYRRRAYGTGQ